MCGIVGAIAKQEIEDVLLEGLSRLEYRGYDSAGIAIISKENVLQVCRRVGKVNELREALKKEPMHGMIGVSHTRWATHGAPAERNAHPHQSDSIVVVHNGIIENYEEIKAELITKGYKFNSETDTEVIAHLIQEQRKTTDSLLDATKKTMMQLRGAYGALIMDRNDPNRLIAARSGSPLVIGVSETGNYIASDPLALLPVTSKFIYLEEGDIAEIEVDSFQIWDNQNQKVTRKISETEFTYDAGDKGNFTHYMQKEIYEQPLAIKNTLANRIQNETIDLSEIGLENLELLKQVEHIQILACGTAFNAGFVAKYWFESLLNLSCDVEIASEYRYRHPARRNKSLVIALSQSGETADTLAAMRLAKKNGCLATLSICNVASSTLVRETDLTLLTHAGTEIGVASTKAFTTQLTVLLLLIGQFAKLKNNDLKLESEIVHALQRLPSRIDQLLDSDSLIAKMALQFKDRQHTLFLGRGAAYPIAVEAALKLKEISYIHAEAYAAGELKHGPLALIDENMPVIVLAPFNDLFEKLKANIEEVRARKGLVYIFTDKPQEFTENATTQIMQLPIIEELTMPIYYTIPMQLLCYHIALVKGTDVDKPRNLAKSVTVE